MVGESGIKANSAQFSWSLAELGKNCWVSKILVKEYVGSKKTFLVKIFFGSNNFLGPKFLGSKNFFRQKNFLGQKKFWFKKIFGLEIC